MRLLETGYKSLIIAGVMTLFALPALATTEIEDFTALNNGELHGQTNWATGVDGIGVIGDFLGGDGKVLKLLCSDGCGGDAGTGNFRRVPTEITFSSGSIHTFISWDFYLTDIATSSSFGINFRDSAGTTKFFAAQLSHFESINKTSLLVYARNTYASPCVVENNCYQTISDYDISLNAWHHFTAEIDKDNQQIRFKIDNKDYSPWISSANAFTQTGQMRVYLGDWITGGVTDTEAYVDNFYYDYYDTETAISPTTFFATPTSTAAAILANISDQFSDTGFLSIAILSAAIILGFWGFEKFLEMTPK